MGRRIPHWREIFAFMVEHQASIARAATYWGLPRSTVAGAVERECAEPALGRLQGWRPGCLPGAEEIRAWQQIKRACDVQVAAHFGIPIALLRELLRAKDVTDPPVLPGEGLQREGALDA